MSKHYNVQRYVRNLQFELPIMQNSSHTDPIFKATSIMKITDQYIFQSSVFVFDFITKYLPYSFHQMFRFNNDIPNSRATRQSYLLYETRCKTHFANKLPLYAIPQIWNKWSNLASGITSRSQFKRLIKSSLVLSY